MPCSSKNLAKWKLIAKFVVSTWIIVTIIGFYDIYERVIISLFAVSIDAADAILRLPHAIGAITWEKDIFQLSAVAPIDGCGAALACCQLFGASLLCHKA